MVDTFSLFVETLIPLSKPERPILSYFAEMKKVMLKRFLAAGILCFPLFFNSCTKDRILLSDDSNLYDEVKDTAGYVYYQNGNTLSGAAPSPHGSFKLRFNSIAAAALDATGELPVGGTFPEGSIVVKERIANNAIVQLAVMKKTNLSADAAQGWLWGEYSPSGNTDYSTTRRGDICTGCHSGSPHRDLVRTFDLH